MIISGVVRLSGVIRLSGYQFIRCYPTCVIRFSDSRVLPSSCTTLSCLLFLLLRLLPSLVPSHRQLLPSLVPSQRQLLPSLPPLPLPSHRQLFCTVECTCRKIPKIKASLAFLLLLLLSCASGILKASLSFKIRREKKSFQHPWGSGWGRLKRKGWKFAQLLRNCAERKKTGRYQETIRVYIVESCLCLKLLEKR